MYGSTPLFKIIISEVSNPSKRVIGVTTSVTPKDPVPYENLCVFLNKYVFNNPPVVLVNPENWLTVPPVITWKYSTPDLYLYSLPSWVIFNFNVPVCSTPLIFIHLKGTCTKLVALYGVLPVILLLLN